VPQQSLRFGVFDGAGHRAATWKCWSPAANENVYVSCRELHGALKASLHESGSWHIAYDGKFFDSAVRPEDKTEKRRFIDKWQVPKPIAPGLVLAFRIVTPWSSVSTPCDNMPEVFYVPKPAEGKAIEFDLFIIEPTTLVSGWPGKNSMNTSLVGSYALPSGRSVWVVYWEIPTPQLPTRCGKANFFEGKSFEDLKGDGLKLLAFGEEPDGSKVIYDYTVSFEDRGT
jgi:hypothetical protein